jgi:hypothetical protein
LYLQQIEVESYSTAFDAGKSAPKITYTLPATWKPPTQAPAAPTNLKAQFYGSEVQVGCQHAA